jgi:thioredoxin reductase (NADPH)
MNQMRAQVERFGTEFVRGDITAVDLKKNPFRITTDEELFYTQTLIIASGASAKLMGLPSERRLMGHGVSACATCDGFFFREKEVVVIGGGDTAMEEATFLTKFASKVTIIHRRDSLRASKIMQDRAKTNPKISFLWDTVIEDVKGDPVVTGVRLKNLKTGQITEMKCDGVFVAIGHEPNTKLFADQLKLDEHGYIVTKKETTETSMPGVFAAGDVQDHRYRQAVTAAGTGCMAAMDAEKYLETLH